MPLPRPGAQRASRRSLRLTLIAALAAAFVIGGLATPAPTNAATMKVVIVVGPVGSKTAEYKDSANALATQVAGYGAKVYKVYSPYATWSKVKEVAQGANLLIYLGHGNGWPSPYCCFQRYTKDGFGLNATAGNGNSNVKYWGEYYIDRYINLAPNAVVIMHRLCYASGNPEWGQADPSRSTAIKRVDNYGAGFLRANAKVVMALGLSRPTSIIRDMFKSNKRLLQAFYDAPDAVLTYRFGFESTRTPGMIGRLDPRKPSGGYYRSIVGDIQMTADKWRAAGG